MRADLRDRGSLQAADRPQGSVPQHAARPAPRGIARQGRPARVRRELRADGGPGNVVLAAHRRSSSTPAPNSSQADGFSSRSGWLTSSTFGGGSWLAHATLQSGVWVNSPGRYSALIASKRLTLTAAFRRAGWRTVADVPATHGSWPEGHSFYHYDEDLGPRQPRVSRPEIRLLARCRTSTSAPGAAEARAGEAEPPPRLLRDRPHVEPRAVDPHPTAHLLEPARRTDRSSTAYRSTGPA